MTDYLLLIFLFLIAGVIAVPLATRFGLGSVLGYLIAGMILSPALTLLGVDIVSVQHFAEFGVVMMLFLVGLELEPRMLWAMRAKLIGLGGLQVAGTTAAVMAVAMMLGQPWSIALAIGLVLTLSSTAIVVQTLNEKGLLRSDGGQSSFAVLLFQDVAVIPMLALIPLLAMPELLDSIAHGAAGEDHRSALSLVEGLPAWQAGIVTLGAIAAVVAGGALLTRPIFRFVASAGLRELFTATALMMVVGIALLMSLVGLSPALGTFLAGVVLANSEYRHELESNIDPFRGLLLGLFFMTVGAGINFALLAGNAAIIAGLTLGLIALKVSILLILAQIFKLRGSDRWLFALGLAQAGEFGFVLLSLTVANGVIPPAISDLLLLIVALSMILTPALFILYDKVIAPRFAVGQDREADVIEHQGPIIIAGLGRFGGIVNRMVRGAGYETTVVDYSSTQLEMVRAFGVNCYFGDATRPDLLHAAGIDEAKVLVIAIDGKEQITNLVRYAVQTYPHLHIVARAVDRTHVYDLFSVGCRDIIRETYDSSIRAGRSVLEAMGIERVEADRMASEFDILDRKAMVDMARAYDIDVPAHQNEAFIALLNELRDDWEEQLRGKMMPQPKSGDIDPN